MNTQNRYLALAIVGVLAMIVLIFNVKVSPAHDLGLYGLI
jgi:hypothetical protein